MWGGEIPSDTLRQNVDLLTARGNNSTVVEERSVNPQGYDCNPPLPAVSESGAHRHCGLLDLTTTSQTNLLRQNGVQNEAMRVIGNHREHDKWFKLDLPPLQDRQTVEQVKAYFNAEKKKKKHKIHFMKPRKTQKAT